MGITGQCSNCGNAKCSHFVIPLAIPAAAPAPAPMPKITITGTGRIVLAGAPMKVALVEGPVDAMKMFSDPEEIRAKRKKDGVCIECGDRGTFINLECRCTKGHGKIF